MTSIRSIHAMTNFMPRGGKRSLLRSKFAGTGSVVTQILCLRFGVNFKIKLDFEIEFNTRPRFSQNSPLGSCGLSSTRA
jgi:hypothetical protein